MSNQFLLSPTSLPRHAPPVLVCHDLAQKCLELGNFRFRLIPQENVEVFKAAPGCAVLGLRLHNGRYLARLSTNTVEHVSGPRAAAGFYTCESTISN